jgi:predicted DNA-binding WGR domain protein
LLTPSQKRIRHVTPGTFGDWALVREWGSVGSPGTVRKDWFATEDEAIEAVQKLCEAKQKKGYHPRKIGA